MTTEIMMRSSYPTPDFPLRPQGQPDPHMGIGCGPCDPLSERRPQAAEPWGYSTGLITLSQDGSGNLVLSADSEILKLFVAGPTDGGAQQGYPGPLTEVQTDTYREGANVKSGEKMVVTQIGAHFDRLCRVEVVGSTITQVYEPWMSAYDALIRDVLRNNLSMSFVMGDDKCERLLGVPAFWREHSDSEFGVSSITPLRVPFRTGEKDAFDKLELMVNTGYGLRFANNLEWPALSAVSVPFRVMLYGYVECEVDVCEVPRRRQSGYEAAPLGYAQPVVTMQQPYQQQPPAYAQPTAIPELVAALSDPAMRPHLQRALATLVGPTYPPPPATPVPG